MHRFGRIFGLMALIWIIGPEPVPAQGADAGGDAEKTALAVEALTRLQGVDINTNPRLKEAVLKVLARTRGTPSFVKLVQQFKLADQNAGLVEVATANPATEAGVEALRLVISTGDTQAIEKALASTNRVEVTRLAEALGNTGDKQMTRLLLPMVRDAKQDVELRKQCVRSLCKTADGASSILQLAREDQLPQDLKFTAGAELNAVRWPDLKSEAAKLFPPAQAQNATALPPIAALVRMKGDIANGARLYTNASPGCINCHVVNGRGTELGPNLSEIGGKLGKDALLEAILEPSSGISFGYEAHSFTLKNGDEIYGLLASETADEVAVKNVGGVVVRLKKSEIEVRQQSKLSIMPSGLQAALSVQELVDLVEYLASLRKAPVP